MARREIKSPLKPNTQGGRLLRALVLAWPGYSGGPDEWGNDFHTGRNRMGDALEPRGFRTVSQQREGYPWYEYRFETEEIYRQAAVLVRSWDLGIDVRLLRAREAFREKESSGASESDSGRTEVSPRLAGSHDPSEGRSIEDRKPETGRLRATQAELELAREGGPYES